MYSKVGLKKAVADFCRMLKRQDYTKITPGRKFEEPTQNRKAICQLVSFCDEKAHTIYGWDEARSKVLNTNRMI